MTLSGTSKLAGVLGWPVSHSRSPRLHGYWLQHHGIDGAYVPLAVEPLNFSTAVRGLAQAGFQGANVTVPHKERAYALATSRDDFAARTGAVNTLVFGADGEIQGSNTDGFGFIENLRQGAPDLDLTRGPAVVLGAGGAARAILVALADAGAPEIRLTNRTRAKADQLVDDLGVTARVYDWHACEAALPDAALLVNTTSLGMAGQPPLDLALDRLPTGAAVNDIVYSPLTTPLLADAAARGNPVVDGLGMLLHQARPGFNAWFGVDPRVTDDLRAFVAADLMEAEG
jgi:shikimate dehydrogenase